MAVDPKIISTIEEVVGAAEQPSGLGKRLTKWFESIANGDENIDNIQDAARRLILLYNDVQIDSDTEINRTIIAATFEDFI